MIFPSTYKLVKLDITDLYLVLNDTEIEVVNEVFGIYDW